MSSQSNNNARVIQQAEGLQRSTRESLRRIQQQTEETEELGEFTLHGLREQRQQLVHIEEEEDRVKEGLRETKRLQNKFDRWAMNWGGGKKREAKRQGQVEAKALNRSVNQKQQETAANVAPQMSHHKDMQSWSTNKSSKNEFEFRKVALLPEDYSGLDSSEAVSLSNEDRAGLCRLESADDDIEQLLDEAADSLERLGSLAQQMGEESQKQSQQIEGVQTSMDRTQQKQASVSARIKLNLVGRFRNRADKE